MSESKIETTIGLSVVALTRFLMSKYQLNQEAAYRKLARKDRDIGGGNLYTGRQGIFAC